MRAGEAEQPSVMARQVFMRQLEITMRKHEEHFRAFAVWHYSLTVIMDMWCAKIATFRGLSDIDEVMGKLCARNYITKHFNYEYKTRPHMFRQIFLSILASCAIWNVLVFSISEDPNGTPALEPSTGNMNTAEKSTSSINAANAIGEADKIGRANGDNDLNE